MSPNIEHQISKRKIACVKIKLVKVESHVLQICMKLD